MGIVFRSGCFVLFLWCFFSWSFTIWEVVSSLFFERLCEKTLRSTPCLATTCTEQYFSTSYGILRFFKYLTVRLLNLNLLFRSIMHVQYNHEHYFINPPTIEALQLKVAVEVKTSQLTVLPVDPKVHTGTFLTGFYCHCDHPEQYQIMLLPVKNSWLIFTCKCTCTYYT